MNGQQLRDRARDCCFFQVWPGIRRGTQASSRSLTRKPKLNLNLKAGPGAAPSLKSREILTDCKMPVTDSEMHWQVSPSGLGQETIAFFRLYSLGSAIIGESDSACTNLKFFSFLIQEHKDISEGNLKNTPA